MYRIRKQMDFEGSGNVHYFYCGAHGTAYTNVETEQIGHCKYIVCGSLLISHRSIKL